MELSVGECIEALKKIKEKGPYSFIDLSIATRISVPTLLKLFNEDTIVLKAKTYRKLKEFIVKHTKENHVTL